jgi:NAD(P)-dependent dehydrogenase (short-subunit alcohol dehydrogenase family)
LELIPYYGTKRGEDLGKLQDLGLQIDLTDRNAIVTGAASGMGAGTAEAFADAGATVLAVDRNENGLDELVNACRDYPGTVIPMVADLEDASAPSKVIDRARSRFSRLDRVVLAAGVFEQSSFVDTTDESFYRQMAVNLHAPFFIARGAVPLMSEGGSIVFFSSIANLIGFPESAAYGASKGAITGLTRTTAVELAPSGIRVNAVAPGTIDTPINTEMLSRPGVREAILSGIPANRLGVADDVVAAVVFLASDAARHVVGQVIAVDGGQMTA